MPTIRSVELARLDYALVGDFKFFKSGRRPSLLVRLTDEAGAQGCGQSLAKAALDLACYDLWGRQTARPVYELLGGKAAPEEIKLSWTVNATSLEAARAQMEKGKAAGYDSFNVK